MKTLWHEMSFLEKLWTVVKSVASTPVSYTSTDSSSSSFDDDDSSISSSMSDDDSPTRGLWDPTSIYYASMHDDSTSVHSLFDD